jgi:hypothetical protein
LVKNKIIDPNNKDVVLTTNVTVVNNIHNFALNFLIFINADIEDIKEEIYLIILKKGFQYVVPDCEIIEYNGPLPKININVNVLMFEKEDREYVCNEAYTKHIENKSVASEPYIDRVTYDKEHPKSHAIFLSDDEPSTTYIVNIYDCEFKR